MKENVAVYECVDPSREWLSVHLSPTTTDTFSVPSSMTEEERIETIRSTLSVDLHSLYQIVTLLFITF